MMRHDRRAAAMLAVLWLTACAGDYDGVGGSSGLGGGGGQARNLEAHFNDHVAPTLDFCRTCHVPGGIADVEEGEQFMLSANSGQDFDNLVASWERLGGNNPTSRILLMASGQETPHSGGAPWPEGSAPYRNMEILLKCLGDPEGCAGYLAGGVDDPLSDLPLLGSKRARHVWQTFCEGGEDGSVQPDSAMLPTDPRTLVRPGINPDRAVYFNAFWENCHANLPDDQQHPKTCGEYRSRRDRGFHFLQDDLSADGGLTGVTTAEEHNATWQKWGLDTRPADFDEMFILRYGLNPAPFRNPYPLPGEDPNQTEGGTGQLPLGLRQIRDNEGRWTGNIGLGACFACHGGSIGDNSDAQAVIGIENLGLGNNNFDTLMFARDGMPTAGTALAPVLPPVDTLTLFNIGIKQRGQNNAVGAFELLVTLLDFDTLGVNPDPVKTLISPTGVIDQSHPLAHTQDTPAWWNFGSRPRKFFDAGVSSDSTRIIMAAGPATASTLFSLSGEPFRDRIKAYDLDVANYFLSLESPTFPGSIDTALAEQGAVLFHSKDLWAVPANADRPRPSGGNGSCASCHGAYSPRYVHDPGYLETPALEGVAGHIVPLDVIGTDPARSDMLTPTLRQRWATTYWGYPDNLEGWTPPQQKDPVTELLDDLLPRAGGALQPPLARVVGVCEWEQTVIGYQAPPLYGTWATAPYFHNGSVPTIEAVLDSRKRYPIWQRQLQTLGPVTGFDQSLARAYDFDALGWKHTPLDCADIPGTGLYNCNPLNAESPSLVQLVTNFLNQTVALTGIVPVPDLNPDGFDRRLVFDTRVLGNDNGGHDFSDALTDQERAAIMEYLKTL